MLDQWLGNARGADPTNTYFFRILLSADRGMSSAETMAQLEARRLPYILGVRERTDSWYTSWRSTMPRRSRRW
jgi:hypothetical protein